MWSVAIAVVALAVVGTFAVTWYLALACAKVQAVQEENNEQYHDYP